MAISVLHDYIEKKRLDYQPAADYLKAEADAKQLRQEWLAQVRAFYKQIQGYLQDYPDVHIQLEDAIVQEEGRASYSLEQMKLTLFEHSVSLVPIGADIIGAKGRIDMIGAYDTIMFLLLEADNEAVLWKVFKPSSDLHQHVVTDEVFARALLSLLHDS